MPTISPQRLFLPVPRSREERRICTGLGLQREPQYCQLTPIEAHLRRWLFWSVYVVERYVSWGRWADRSASQRILTLCGCIGTILFGCFCNHSSVHPPPG